VPKLCQHPANLAFFPLGQDELEHRRVTLVSRETGAPGANLAIREPDTLGQPFQDFAAGISGHQGSIRFFNTIARMSQAVGQFTVVGQNHQSRAVFVEPAYRVDPFGNLGQQVDHAGSSGGIIVGGDIPLGLVYGIINELFQSHFFSIHGDDCARRVNPRS
jgi:hypothetical protein